MILLRRTPQHGEKMFRALCRTCTYSSGVDGPKTAAPVLEGALLKVYAIQTDKPGTHRTTTHCVTAQVAATAAMHA